MSTSTRPATATARVLAVLPPVLVLASAIGYVGIDLWPGGLPEAVPGGVPPLVHAGLVGLQALALAGRRRFPTGVFATVVLADLVILATTAGELGIGALAVVFASYSVARHTERRDALVRLGAGAVLTTVVGGVAMAVASTEPPFVLIVTAVTRIALLYVAPAAVADYVRGRERLAEALDEQARMTERERRDRAERELRDERAALARELHDIAGHHLSGIIVSAQAASALTGTDPDRARAMMRTVQDDARTTLADLRRTVGLLRSDDDGDVVVAGTSGRASGDPRPVPSLDGIPALVDAAITRGQQVELVVDGDPRPLGPLAETAAYRMVQESLANAARHAAGSACWVVVSTTARTVEVSVENGPSAASATFTGSRSVGYGLSGMAERAELIGAALSTGPTAEGGWLNRLVIPVDGRDAG
jgi:signal transduction histidine kinase